MKKLNFNKNNKLELRKEWLKKLNLFLDNKCNIRDVWQLANQIYNDISLGFPKVDDIFFASVEYFIVDKLPQKETIIKDIKQMTKLLSNPKSTIDDFKIIWNKNK